MTKIKNKTILITGGASGIGKLMAKKCLQIGAKQVVLWDINEKALNETTAEFEKFRFKVHPYVVDVSKPEDINWAAEDVLATAGKVDILFNNAGIEIGKPFVEHSDAEIQRTMDINVLGVMRVCKAFLPVMITTGSGHIINIASAAGLIPNPNMSVYSSSKWAVIGWSESLRLELEELKQGIRVLTVTPSYINTGMFDGVKAPMLTPIMEPNDIVNRIIKAIEHNEIILRAPFIVNSVPILRGLLPTRLFDFVADKMGVYDSMSEFKGKKS